MRALAFLMLLLLTPILLLAEETAFTLRAGQWDEMRHSENLLAHAELSAFINVWLSVPNARMELRYPGGEEGEIWVHDVYDRLVALAIPSSRLQMLPGSGSNDTIYLVLMTPQE